MNSIDPKSISMLPEGEVRLWWMQASSDAAEVARVLLSEQELERAEQFRVKRARAEFMVGRASLRLLVGHAIGVAPLAVKFKSGEQGKPAVDGVEFSVTHSQGLIGIALGRGFDIGLDVEALDRGVEALEIAQHSFAAEEVREIEQAGDKTLTFCRIWTRKEAVLKAHGHGLMKPLDGFAVSAGISGEQKVGLDGREFFVREIETRTGFVGALACTVPGVVVREMEEGLVREGIRN